MVGAPYFGFPNLYRRNFRNYYNRFNTNNYPPRGNSVTYNNISSSNSDLKENVSTDNSLFVDKTSQNEHNSRFFGHKKNPDNSCLFELFGLKLYFDDILIVCLLYFLYNEGVKDEGLFIALILLLLS